MPVRAKKIRKDDKISKDEQMQLRRTHQFDFSPFDRVNPAQKVTFLLDYLLYDLLDQKTWKEQQTKSVETPWSNDDFCCDFRRKSHNDILKIVKGHLSSFSARFISILFDGPPCRSRLTLSCPKQNHMLLLTFGYPMFEFP